VKFSTRPVLVSALTALCLVAPTACDGGEKADGANAADEQAPAKDAAAPADAAPADDETIKGKPVEGDAGAVAKKPAADGETEYTVVIEPPAEVPAGSDAMVTIKVVPQGEWHMNLDFPTSLTMAAPDGVALAKEKLVKADALKLDDTNCEFGVGFTPSTPGDKKFTGKLKFAVCQDEACAPKTEEVEFVVAVK
jgi:hypothetical protein